MEALEAINLLYRRVNEEIKNSGWWIFNKRNLELFISRIFEPYEKTANLPLHPELNFPNLIVRKYGIKYFENLIEWTEICATRIKTERLIKNEFTSDVFENHLLISDLNAAHISAH